MSEISEELNNLEIREQSYTRNLKEILADYGYPTKSQVKSKLLELDSVSLMDTGKRIRKLVGDRDAETVLCKGSEGRNNILVTVPYAESISAVIIIDANKASKFANINVPKHLSIGDSLEVQDIVFVNQDNSRAFSYRSILGGDHTIEIHDRLSFDASGGSKIMIPPLGQFKPPREPISRGMWNVYKKVEPIVLFHEAKHCQQRKERKMYGAVEGERDAWAYAIKMYRKLKTEGLNLLPELSSNEQIISRIELGLITYDLSHTRIERSDYFSKRTFGLFPKGVNNPLIQTLRIINAVAQTAIKDLSLVADTLLYKGRPNLARVSLTEMLKKQ